MISSGDMKVLADSGAAIAGLAAKTVGRTSLTRMSDDSVFQFPMLFGSDIDDAKTAIVAKGMEVYCASLVMSAISLNNTVDIRKYSNAGEFLKKFHSNKAIPSNIKAATTFLLESATAFTPNHDIAIEGADEIIDSLRSDRLNTKFLPFERTKKIVRSRIEDGKAFEAAYHPSDAVLDRTAELGTVGQMVAIAGLNAAAYDDEYLKSGTNRNDKAIANTKGPAFVELRNEYAIKPTLVNVRLTFHGGGTAWSQDVVIGVKALAKRIRSDVMVSNMVKAAKGSNAIFDFIKWSDGQLKLFRDVILGVSESKEAALSARTNSNWLHALKRRKNIDRMSRFFQNRVPPNTFIFISDSEASEIKNQCGVDLREEYNAANLISKYYILGFGIVDTNANTLDLMLDGQTEFATMPLATLKGTTSKEIELTDNKGVVSRLPF